MPDKYDWKTAVLGIVIAITLVVAYRAWTGPVRLTVGFVKGQMPPCDSTNSSPPLSDIRFIARGHKERDQADQDRRRQGSEPPDGRPGCGRPETGSSILLCRDLH